MTDNLDKLESLFKETGTAHHHAFEATDGVDPEWPSWYAGHLHSSLNDRLGAKLTKSELVYLIVAAEKQRVREDPDAPWPGYYAQFVLEHNS